jgi:hypothetical protein
VRGLVPAGVYVTGPSALTLDLDEQLSRTLPLFIGAILAAAVLLLMLVFRSVVVPLKAALMNLLSIGGAYGVIVAVFQWGWFGPLFGLHGTYRIASPLPVLFFAVLFGLSMDYEVFPGLPDPRGLPGHRRQRRVLPHLTLDSQDERTPVPIPQTLHPAGDVPAQLAQRTTVKTIR